MRLFFRKRKLFVWLILLSFSAFFSFAFLQPQSNSSGVKGSRKMSFIEGLLWKHPDKFAKVLSNPKFYRLQIIYTQINRDSNNVPHFKQYTYRLNPKEYFYPASLVKIPVVAMALQKLNELNIPGLDKFSRMKTDSAYSCEQNVLTDSTAQNGFPSVANYIRRAMLVSDNDAYNRLYEFLGQKYMNINLTARGYKTARIINRFYNCDTLANRYTNPITFFNQSGEAVYSQPLEYSPNLLKNVYGKVLVGKGYIENGSEGKPVNHPKEFTYANYLNLQDASDILRSIIFPNAVPKEKRFNLTKEDYRFLYRYLSMYPSESDFPSYKRKDFGDSFKKYFIYGNFQDTITDKNLRIFNHVGQAYGFLSDCSYVVDFENKVEFMLAATIYVNKDGIINDGKYEYKDIGFPFLAELGKAIYEYEKKRTRKVKPDLKEFRMEY